MKRTVDSLMNAASLCEAEPPFKDDAAAGKDVRRASSAAHQLQYRDAY
jgi:hypothetical protein